MATSKSVHRIVQTQQDFQHMSVDSRNNFPSLLYIKIDLTKNFVKVKVKKVKLSPLIESDPKAPFSIATTPRCGRGRYSIPRIVPLYLDPHLIMLSAKQGGIKYHFLSLWYDSTRDWTTVSWTIGEHFMH